MTQPYDISLAIESNDGAKLYSEKDKKLRESSSTIKVPIILLAAKKMAERDNKLSDFLVRLPHHNTRGSGILNWTSANRFSFSDLISTTLIYSDCLATNVLIDYVGGQPKINNWLESEGYHTRMVADYLLFDGSNERMPKVGTTTAEEMLNIYKKLDNEPLPDDIRDTINQSSMNVNESWLQTNINAQIDNLRHKTGSMINCGLQGETVYNAVGTFIRSGLKYYFCILTRGRFDHASLDKNPDPMQRYVANYFDRTIESL